LLKFWLNGKTAMSTNYYKLQNVAWSVVLCKLHQCSPIWTTVYHIHLLCTSLHRTTLQIIF